ncbi:HAMP domain-containing sensor histidine kinase [Symbiobacterium terraclitae]|uniref:HAMP domain-containing sensor histidine kinase n=1 Tax=Symbiobacterium terraclitae TaxID=557451 RepID=UPI0035B56146
MARALIWSQAFSIRAKIVGLSVGLVLLMGSAATWMAQSSFMRSTLFELDRRGESIARDVAARGVDMLLTHNVFGLHELLAETLGNNPDVRYVVILDARQQVAAHTFGRGFPADLLALPIPAAGEKSLVQILQTEEGRIHDVSVPILDGTAGTVRVGMSLQRLQRAAMNQAQWLALAVFSIASVAILGAWVLTRILTRPVVQMVHLARTVAAGDLSQRVPPGPPDELGLLSQAFNAMLDQLQMSQQVRNDLLDRIMVAQEDERRRIARELHDETSQAITSIVVGLRALEAEHPVVVHASANLRRLASETLDEIHGLILELRPRALDELGLVAALSRYVTDFSHKHAIRTEFELVGHETRLPYRVETCLYRVAQEALTNVARHSGATTACVVLDLRPEYALVIVEDDGCGFDPEAVGPRSLGLVGMRERVALLDGTLEVESAPGSGTTVFARVPLRGHDHGVANRADR